MSFTSYEEVRPWAPVIMYRTAIRDRMGAMPPWYVEKNIGITDGFESDYSLSDLDLAMIQAWAGNGAPRGNPADEPPPLFSPMAMTGPSASRSWCFEAQIRLGRLLVRTGGVISVLYRPG